MMTVSVHWTFGVYGFGPQDPERGEGAGNAGAERERENLLIEP